MPAVILLVAFAVAVALIEPAQALEVPPRPAGRVSDYAGVLHPEDGRILADRLRDFEEATSNQVVIAIFPSLEGENLEAYSMRLAETWKIGQAGKDNGVIISVFIADRKMRIEVGYGLEGALPDVVCKHIIDDEMSPRFKEGQYAIGLAAAVDKIGAATRGEYRVLTPWEALLREVKGGPHRNEIYLILFFFQPPGLILFGVVLYKSFRGQGRVRRCSRIFTTVFVVLTAMGYLAGGLVGSAAGLAFATALVFSLDSGIWRPGGRTPCGVVFGSSGSAGDWSSGSGSGWSGGDSGFSGGGGSFGGGGASGGW